MNKSYENINDFINACHEELSIKKLIVDLGFVKESDFRGDFLSCIFHQGDNTPSLQVTDNFFKCYACGAKGDIFKFIQLHLGMNFMESVRYLADFLNVKVADMKYKYDDKLAELASRWDKFVSAMNKLDPKLAMQLRRDFYPETIGYDDYEGMVVLPITSKSGAVLGFTKRRIDEIHTQRNWVKPEGGFTHPKWKHSSLNDSLINLCHNLYNLASANAEIHKKNEVIITEGPKDVIAYKRIGIGQVVCSCGTSNASNAFEALLPIGRIVLSMDGDSAGKKSAANTILYLASIFNIKNVDVVMLTEGKDPYDISPEELTAAYNNTIPALKFYVAYCIDDPSGIYELYNVLKENNEYNCAPLIKEVCLAHNFSVPETESWIKPIKKPVPSTTMTEKERLIKIINGEDVLGFKISIDKAKRILKLKYGYEC